MKTGPFTLAVITVICLVLAGCSSSIDSGTKEQPDRSSTPAESNSEEAGNPSQSTIDAVDSFIEEFNQLCSVSIENVMLIPDIQDTSSEYYRTEFRLQGFKGALAKAGTIRDGSVLILSMKTPSEQSRPKGRFYATVEDLALAQEVMICAARVYDGSITREDVIGLYQKAGSKYVTVYGEVEGVSVTEINGGYIGEGKRIGILFERRGTVDSGFYYEIMVKNNS